VESQAGTLRARSMVRPVAPCSSAGSLADAIGGSAFASAGSLGRVGLHAAAGCAQSAMAGGGCRSGAIPAGFAELVGPRIPTEGVAANTVKFAVLGGAGATLSGGKFANGALTGSFGYLFNEVGHLGQRGYAPTFYDDGTVCNAGLAGCTNWSGAIEPVYPELALPALRGVGLIVRALDLFGPSSDLEILFGTNRNDPAHATRWLVREGVDVERTQAAIRADLNANNAATRPVGQGWTGAVSVDGRTVNYSAYRLPDGRINVGSTRPQ
jgi:hypothetical protein